MVAEVGGILVGLGLAAALYAAFATFRSIRRADARWAASGRNGLYATAALLGLALMALLFAFLGDRFQIRYVAQHSSRALPLHFKVSAVWAGQEGSLLLWSFLQALLAALAVSDPADRSRALIPWTSILLSLITAFFAAVTLFLSNPFAASTTVPFDGQGLNPLLRHPGMIFHPPALYLGYVGLAVPFAFALAGLITRRVGAWPAAARRWARAAWLFLGLGLLLGARWAYDVLGWGGYWGWDPVENAGLMPWLTATALLHGLAMEERRGRFRPLNLLLAILSFSLVLFGTFITRSGLIQSVHAFTRSNLGPYFLGAILLVLAGSAALLYSRRSLLRGPPPAGGLLTREGMFFLTLTLLITLTATIGIGSLLPTLAEAFTGRRFELSPAWFDRVTAPQFAALVLLLGLCPLLGRAAGLRRLRRRSVPAVVGALLAVGIAAWAGFARPASLVGFAAAGLAGGTALAELGRGVGRPWRAARRLFGQHSWYGGYLVHLGVILMAVGVIGSRVYALKEDVVLEPGEPADVGRYTLIYEDLLHGSAGDYLITEAAIAVYRGGRYLGVLRPRVNQYPDSDQKVTVPALQMSLREDLYLVLFWWSPEGPASVQVVVNPLINFLWLGGLIFLVGGLASTGEL